MNCEDIAMNFLVSHITRKPPLKVCACVRTCMQHGLHPYRESLSIIVPSAVSKFDHLFHNLINIFLLTGDIPVDVSLPWVP